jgi:hypothetical protein
MISVSGLEVGPDDFRQWFVENNPRRWFQEFVHDIERFNLAVDLLVLCAKRKTWSEVMGYCQGHGIGMADRTMTIRFLYAQGLLIRTEGRPRRSDGHKESILKAAPQAIDELAYRLVHHGEPSPVPEPPDPDIAYKAARDKLTAALAGAGYHDKAGRRLRVAK